MIARLNERMRTSQRTMRYVIIFAYCYNFNYHFFGCTKSLQLEQILKIFLKIFLTSVEWENNKIIRLNFNLNRIKLSVTIRFDKLLRFLFLSYFECNSHNVFRSFWFWLWWSGLNRKLEKNRQLFDFIKIDFSQRFKFLRTQIKYNILTYIRYYRRLHALLSFLTKPRKILNLR